MKITTISILLFIVLHQCTAQINTEYPDSIFRVNDILIVGNNKTKPFVILREMSLQPGSYITKGAIEYDKNRIYSLQLFNSVDIDVEPAELNKANLIVLVHERWYIYPFPVFGIKDRDWKKIFYGGGIININFRGRNEKIYAIGTLGYEPSLFLFYRNPQIHYESNTFIETSIGYSKSENKSPSSVQPGENFSLSTMSASLNFGRRFGISHTVGSGIAYQIVKVSEFIPERLLNPWGQDAFPIFNIAYKYDTRDLVDYSMYGTLISAKINKYGLGQININYWRYYLDYRRFIPIVNHLTLAARTYTAISSGSKIPSYNRVYLGYDERIRGHFRKLYEGENVFGISTELRFFILPPITLKVDEIPIPEFSVWKFGIAAAIFADAGTTWYSHQSFTFDRFKKGYGAGFHFLLPYSFVLRTEYAFNEYRVGEFIFDISAAF
ncbi:MAG: POTRA domain-containing protein [Bacteroidota bacterium]|nr:POTRA domain-containing protein [Bacteroidota bacterium]